MNTMLQDLELRKQYLNQNLRTISPIFLNRYEEDFMVRYTHESTKMEGNTLSIFEVRTLLVDQISIGGKSLRELYEVIDHHKAWGYIKNAIKENRSLSEDFIMDVHQIMIGNNDLWHVYRSSDTYFLGDTFIPVEGSDIRNKLSFLIDQYSLIKRELPALGRAAWLHAEYFKSRPFPKGNGKTARLLMNFVLMNNGYFPINIPTERREQYDNSLDAYVSKKVLKDLLCLIYEEEKKIIQDYEAELQLIK